MRPDQRDWVLKVPLTEFAINSSVNKSMGYALFELIYGVNIGDQIRLNSE